jgi:ligand-binding sensor domain-containing protein/AraC-like DNA-binding protein
MGVLLAVQAAAQQARDFTFAHLGRAEGLSNQRVYTVRQTTDGVLWWSTKDGVDRYNGVSICHYAIGNTAVFGNYAGRITKLAEAAGKALMAFDNKGGIYAYDEVQDGFVLRTDLATLFKTDVLLNDVLFTEKGLWLAMREGVYYLEGRQLVPVLKDVYTSTVVSTRDGMLLCTKDGVLRYKGGETAPQEGAKLEKLLPIHVESGYYDALYDRVWLGGFQSGLHILTQSQAGTSEEYPITGDPIVNPVRSVCPYNDSIMLVGIDGQGVYKVPRLPSPSRTYRSELLFDANDGPNGVLHGNGIYAVMLDKWGNVVIGSYSGGIDIARPVGSTPAVFQHGRNNQQSLLNDRVNCVAQLPSGLLAMGTDNGVSLHNPYTQHWQHVCRGAVVLSLCTTPAGTLLAATWGKGVYEIGSDGSERQLYTLGSGVLKDDHVYKLFYDRDGNLWMGCLDGDLVQKTPSGNRYYPINNVQDIVQLPDGSIAIGTANGIWLIDTKTGKVSELDYGATISPDNFNKYIHTLFVNDNGELWIGTDGGGVYVYDLAKKQCRQLTTANGLPSNVVCSIGKDNRGRLFISTEHGLSFVSPQYPGQVADVNYCYGVNREYSARAVAVLRNGHILYGTTEGALIVNPNNIQALNYSANLRLRGIRCAGSDDEDFKKAVHQTLNNGGALRLGYGQRTFELYYECINLRNQYDIAYQYKVGKGDWSQPTDQQYIRFANLEPGSHQLLLRSVSRTCGVVIDEVRLTVNVAQPWWNSWWMWLIYAALLVVAFYVAWRVYQLHSKYMRLVISNLHPETAEVAAIKPEERVGEEPQEEPKTEEGSFFIDKVTKLVMDHLSESDFNIDRLCREMAMSRTLFYIKLKSYTGNSPQDFIRVIRLERAAAMLRSGHSVNETAALTGFENSKYFSTVFKKYFGVSPSKYQ